MSKNEYYQPYYVCVVCFEELHTRDFLGQDMDYCDNELCPRYGVWTLVYHYITKPEDVEFWRNRKPHPPTKQEEPRE